MPLRTPRRPHPAASAVLSLIVLAATLPTVAAASPPDAGPGVQVVTGTTIPAGGSATEVGPTARDRVYQTSWPTSGSHTIKIKVLGTAGHPRVDMDAFLKF